MKKRLKLLCEKAAHCLWTPADLTFRKLRLSGLPLMRIQLAGRGVGVFLQKGNALVFCFVAEKPGLASVDTQRLTCRRRRIVPGDGKNDRVTSEGITLNYH